MKISKIFKKVSVLALLLATFSTLFLLGGNSVTASAATVKPVELYSSYDNSYYIGSFFTTYIKTNITGSNEHVYIHANISPGGWQDIEGQYVTTLSDGSKIWKVETQFVGFSIDYAIKYQVNGQTYWDNNNNNNYNINNRLGSAVIGVDPVLSASATSYPITVSLKNLGYSKVVKVKYTQDNWATYQEQSLSYQSTNTTDSSEYWKTYLNLNPNTTSNFHYVVSYNVNGVTYWDNNFGSNYNY